MLYSLIDEFASQLPVGVGRWALRCEGGDGLTRNARVRKFDGAANDRVENLVTKRVYHSSEHLTSVQSTCVVHGAHNADNFQARIQPTLHLGDGVHQQFDSA